VAGVVIDGAVRDVGAIAELGVAIEEHFASTELLPTTGVDVPWRPAALLGRLVDAPTSGSRR
jgi:hypothetical protein